MKSITIHQLDNTLAARIQERADKNGLSLNKTIKNLLAEALGINQNVKKKKNDFSEFYGVWSEKDLKEFEKNTADFERIYHEDWK